MKLCNRCRNTKEKKYFRTIKNKLSSNCKEWEKVYDKFYREKNRELLKKKRRCRNGTKIRCFDPIKFKEKNKRANEKYKKRNPEKIKTHSLVRSAVRNNSLFKSKNCAICTKKKKLEAHHEDYKKPLKVVWMCRQCHVAYHRRDLNECVDSLRHPPES